MNVAYFRQRRPGPETQLEDAVFKWIASYFQEGRYQFWAGGSVPLGAGFPDVVAAAYKPELLEIVDMNISKVQILAYLRTVGRARLDTISGRVKLSQRLVVEILDHLIQIQAVQIECNLFTISQIWRTILPEIVSIETKVANWRRAAMQAKRNCIFSHRSFVALPERIALGKKSHPIFQNSGIGLLAINDVDEVRIIRQAKSSQPSVWSYYYRIAFHIAACGEESTDAF